MPSLGISFVTFHVSLSLVHQSIFCQPRAKWEFSNNTASEGFGGLAWLPVTMPEHYGASICDFVQKNISFWHAQWKLAGYQIKFTLLHYIIENRIEIGKTYSVSIKQSKNFQTIQPLMGLGRLGFVACCLLQWTSLKITPKSAWLHYCTLFYCNVDRPLWI